MKAKDEKSAVDWPTLNRLLKMMFRQYGIRLSTAIFAIIVSCLATVLGSYFLQFLIDRYVLPLVGKSQPDFGPLIRALLLMGSIFLLGVLASLTYSQIMAATGQRVQKSLRDEMFVKMQKLPQQYFDHSNTGILMSTYTNDIDTLMQMIMQSFPQLINSVLSFLFSLTMMFVLSWQLSLISVAIFVIGLFIVRFLIYRSRLYYQKQQTAIGQIDGFVEEMLSGLKVIKVFSHEPAAQKEFDADNDEWQDAAAKANIYSTSVFPIMGNVGNFLYVLVAIIGGTLALNGSSVLTLGTIAAFLQLSRSFSQPIAAVSQQLNFVIQGMAGTRRIFELLDQQEEEDPGTVTLVNVAEDASGNLTETKDYTGKWAWKAPQANGEDQLTLLAGNVSFDHVDFAYGSSDVLHDITFDVQAGQKVALVGPTGAGKTTIINVLNRFYDIKRGKITYDGIDIQTIKKDDLRTSLGLILQDTHLFTGTVADNIRYGRLEAGEEEIKQAADLAQATPFIAQLPEGFQTQIDGNGSDLSQGQQQLLAIARAAVADPPVLILDEATSNIDTQTERQIQTGLENLMKGRTSFAIAHRLSTIFNSDLILVIDDGRIIEAGNHEELLEKHGMYYDLYHGTLTLE
ncbi:multidrug ABC transporter ATP-binding and permease protein [Ligilactobacillus salitolerans]|uniref:Multidrug ABC transporter ATP-binding and permease protein n=1 Tax=Ligilactobacillus salitolerans TaxID=1808352 RepID=A0A401IS01_9LACO|nr:ABC transporter ATP-binding protein [Ligilactobacillus salitolerans]GBG94284.1 multidrug ABC transporter ATP-binding and permease protein [Ligilactobacillus salitolerans]